MGVIEFGQARESVHVVATQYDDDWEADEAPSRQPDFTIWLNLSDQGFQATNRFCRDWAQLANRFSLPMLKFRERFCAADHYQIQLPSGRWGSLAVIWGFPMPYLRLGDKLELLRILPRGWHLKQVGRSVKAPAVCAFKRHGRGRYGP